MPSSNKGKTTSRQVTEPWSAQKPYLEAIFREAERLYEAPGPSYFPGATVAPFAPETERALQMQAARASAGSPLNAAAQGVLGETLSGRYLGANPHLQGAIDDASRAVVRNYRAAVAPGIDSDFSLAGRYGSGLHGAARDSARQALAGQLGDIASDLSHRAYGEERARMQQAAMAAPALARQDYEDIAQLAAAGRTREAMAQGLIDEEIDRYDFEQQLPYNKLARYLQLIQGNYGGTSRATERRRAGLLDTAQAGIGLLGGLLSL